PLPRPLEPLVEIAPPWHDSARPPTLTLASADPIARGGMLTGCVQSAVFGSVNIATARVLAADGYDVAAPPQGCCAALSLHAGRLEEGKAFARKLIQVFEEASVDLVVVNASGCGSHLKELERLLAGEPRGGARGGGVSSAGR